MKKIEIKPGTSVKITKRSRALLEQAHKDGLTEMYLPTLKTPENDVKWDYFIIDDDKCWSRTISALTVIPFEDLKKMLYPKPQITFQDSILNLINQEIERVGIENVTPLEKSLLKTLGIYPPQEIKVWDKGKHIATVTKDTVSIEAGDYSKDIIFKLRAAYEKLNK